MHIIFDLDGTVFDTEFAVSRITSELASEKGCEISPERVFREFAGLGSREKFQGIASACGITFSPETLDELSQSHEVRKSFLYMKDHIPVVPFIPETFKALNGAGHTMSIGSSNPSTRSRMGLEKEGLVEFFGDRIYGPDLADGKKKPDPAVFLLAIQSNNAGAWQAVAVVEDSEPGMEAGRAAGAYVIAYLDPRFGVGEEAAQKAESFRKAGADAIIRSFENFMQVLAPEQKEMVEKRVSERKSTPVPA